MVYIQQELVEFNIAAAITPASTRHTTPTRGMRYRNSNDQA